MTPLPPAFDVAAQLAALKGRKSALLYPHDNPDPDSLAAALGLRLLFEKELGVPSVIALGGIVGRAENRAFVDHLRLNLTPVDEVDAGRHDLIALCDTQPETGNNSLPKRHRLDVIVDHHPIRKASARAPWCDIRADLGATSTIVLGYLRARGIPLDKQIATAFFYALRSETRDLGREATPAERDAYFFLAPLADHEALYRIAHPKVPREHFLALDRALRAARVHGDLLAVNLGGLEYPDLVAEMADRLLSFDGARTVLCMGRYAGAAFLSLRLDAGSSRAGTLMRSIVGADGAAGGHGTMAGARLSVPIGSDEALDAAYARIVERACAALNRPREGRPLI